MDFADQKTATFFLTQLQKVLKREHGYILRMDPNISLVERDIDGNIVEGGLDNRYIVTFLEQLGFSRTPYVPDISQITWEFVLPVKGRTEQEIKDAIQPHTKRRIEQALECGVYLKTLKRDELKIFYDIALDTSKRKGFMARGMAYFESMYDEFGPKVRFLAAAINPKRSVDELTKKLKLAEAGSTDSIVEKNAIKSYRNKIDKLKKFFPDLEDREYIIASDMFVLIKPEVLYLFGGSSREYMKLDGQYVLQWEMICEAIRGGYDQYNFYGIPPNINQHPSGYGVYEFKRGFNGKVVELIGEYELPLSPVYSISKFLAKLKQMRFAASALVFTACYKLRKKITKSPT